MSPYSGKAVRMLIIWVMLSLSVVLGLTFASIPMPIRLSLRTVASICPNLAMWVCGAACRIMWISYFIALGIGCIIRSSNRMRITCRWVYVAVADVVAAAWAAVTAATTVSAAGRDLCLCLTNSTIAAATMLRVNFSIFYF